MATYTGSEKQSKQKQRTSTGADSRANAGAGGDGADSGNTDAGNSSSSGKIYEPVYGELGVAHACTFVAALGVLMIGIWHMVELFKNLEDCTTVQNEESCVGKSLFWTYYNTQTTSSNLNSQWRYVFTFEPYAFFDNWQPLILGIIACCQMFELTRWDLISKHGFGCVIFHLVMLLVGCFGYVGQVGIVIGFLVSVVAFIILVLWLIGTRGCYYPTFNFRNINQ